MKLEELFAHAVGRNASDIILSPGSRPGLRVHGEIEHFEDAGEVDADLTERAVRSLVGVDGWARFLETREADLAAELHGQRFRVAAYMRGGGVPALTMRLIPSEVPTPEALGLPKVLSELVTRPQGLILFTGAAGQGKTTSQASLLQLLNRTVSRHVVTVEDPVEFVHASGTCIIDQREVGRDVTSFGRGLRQVLRQTPDVIVIGEMRDLETIEAALTIAETGHLVLSTLHTNDAVQAVTRIVDVFPPHAQEQIRTQLSLALSAVVGQRLVRNLDGQHVLAAEVLINTRAVSNVIREGRAEQLYTTMELDRASGMKTMNMALAELRDRNLIAPAEAERYRNARESQTPPA